MMVSGAYDISWNQFYPVDSNALPNEILASATGNGQSVIPSAFDVYVYQTSAGFVG